MVLRRREFLPAAVLSLALGVGFPWISWTSMIGLPSALPAWRMRCC
jgi:hypothetical protein